MKTQSSKLLKSNFKTLKTLLCASGSQYILHYLKCVSFDWDFEFNLFKFVIVIFQLHCFLSCRVSCYIFCASFVIPSHIFCCNISCLKDLC